MTTGQQQPWLAFLDHPSSWTIQGTPEKNCEACGAPLRFTMSAHGKMVPVNMVSGKVHFEDCPEAWRFRKVKTRKESKP